MVCVYTLCLSDRNRNEHELEATNASVPESPSLDRTGVEIDIETRYKYDTFPEQYTDHALDAASFRMLLDSTNMATALTAYVADGPTVQYDAQAVTKSSATSAPGPRTTCERGHTHPGEARSRARAGPRTGTGPAPCPSRARGAPPHARAASPCPRPRPRRRRRTAATRAR